MSLRVVVSINGETIDDVIVTNRGPVDGVFEEGDEPGGGGARVYSWRSNVSGRSGVVQHLRSDGATRLAALVLDETARTRGRRA